MIKKRGWWIPFIVPFLLIILLAAVFLSLLFEDSRLQLFAIGEDLSKTIEPVLNLIANKGIGPLLAVVIFSLFLLSIGWMAYLAFWRDRKAVKPIRHALSQHVGINDFPNHFRSVDNAFKNSEHFERQWSEFRETMIEPDFNSPGFAGKKWYKNPVRPYEYFSPESTHLPIGFVEVTPNLFVGLGLLLTFVGLIAAISETSDVFSPGADNIDSQQEAIGDMLNITATKFYSSFTALFSSLVLNSALTIWKNWRIKVFNEINDKIELGIRYISPSEMALKQIDEIKEQTKQLETFNTDLRMQLGESIENAARNVTSQIQNASDQQAEKMAAQMRDLQRSNADLMEKIGGSIEVAAENVISQIQDASNQQIEKMSDQTRELQESNADLIGKIGDSIADKLADTAGTVASQVQEASIMGLNKVGERLERASQALNGLPEKLKESSDRFSQSVKHTVEQINRSLTEFAISLDGVTNDLSKKAGEKIKNEMEDAVDKATEEISTSFRSFSGSVADISENMENLNDSLEGAVRSIRQAGGELGRNVSQMSETTDQLKGTTSSLEDITVSARESNQVLSRSIGELKITAESLTETCKGSFQNMEENLDRIQEIFDEHAERYENADKTISEIYKKVEDQIKGSVERMKEHIDRMDNSFTAAMGSMSSIVDGLSEIVDGLNERNEDR
ncbi:MAG: methyl-accepting chemotaxis protein [Gammaproteobacteria bacterium AqS3]|nr:methyl-accepting chemotaxis protein [Gammaproteobacteria bacterium AqS3]